MHIIKRLLLLTSLFFSSIVFALPKPFDATYQITYNGMNLGKMNTSLRYANNQYSYNKVSKAEGLTALLTGLHITENISGTIKENTFYPSQYLYIKKRRRKEKRTQYRFISHTKIQGSFKGKPAVFNVPQGSLDRATVELSLAHKLATKQRMLNHNIVEKEGASTYRFIIQGIEILTLYGKQYHCTKLKVEHADRSRQTIYWMAKELGYLPVKMYHNEKGKAITSTLISIRTY